jgi:hypothetical protein
MEKIPWIQPQRHREHGELAKELSVNSVSPWFENPNTPQNENAVTVERRR